MNISELDKNFKVETNIDKEDIRFLDVRQDPFKVYGLFYENGMFRRMPEDVAATVSPAVLRLHANAAGGRVRFVTDSPYVAIKAKMGAICRMPHFAMTGGAGFDLYISQNGEAERHIKTFIPPYNMEDGFESVYTFAGSGLRELTIHFPLYSEVCELYVGLSESATVSAPTPYRYEKPVVYYGSSITQGGCASRPGMSYQNIISRRLNCDHINLGFSGNAKAEVEIAEYIKNLDMSVFVYDYDHNAPTLQHLQDTHERMFRIIREANPELPIICASRPKGRLTRADIERLEVIKKTCENSRANGDKNVYLIEGTKLMELAGTEGTVDGTHPTDLGFASMAKAFGDLLEKIL